MISKNMIILALLGLLTSTVISVKARRGVKTHAIHGMDYQNDDYEDKTRTLGSEEAVVKDSMQRAMAHNVKTESDHAQKMKQHQNKMKHYNSFRSKSKVWLKKLKGAKNRKEYEQILSGYKQLVKRFKTHFKGCLPPPPPAPTQTIRPPTESRCHSGFRSGWKHGKQWAILITADKASYKEGLKRIQCLTNWLKKKKESIFSICALRGAVQGYKKWYHLRTHKQELEDYITKKRLRESAIYENKKYYKSVVSKLKL